MLDKTAMDMIGGRLRKVFEAQPKGGIPEPLWRLLLALEKPAAVPPRERRTA